MTKKRAALLLLCGALCLLCGCAGADYKKAGSLLEQGDYDGARTIYQKLVDGGGYEDSEEMLKECDYLEANAACESGDYEQAEELYKRLGEDDPRTAEGMQKVTYGRGKQCMESGDYVEAVELLSSTGGYDQSVALIEECAAALLEDPQPGDPVFFGIYEQDENEENGPEPVQWRVLARNGDYVLLLSEYGLGERMFGSQTYSRLFWDDSDIRPWLNNEFYNGVFSDRERAAIQEMTTTDLTSDHVFLLSSAEVEKLLPSTEDRLAHSAENHDSSNITWWLRYYTSNIPGASQRVAGVVTSEGRIAFEVADPPVWGKSVRPVICVCISGQPEDEAQSMALFGCDFDYFLAKGIRGKKPADSGSENSSENSSENTGPRTCPACNGSGSIRFYYGSSDLEAWLTGHDAYTIGPCSMCNGSGRVSGK